MDNSIISSASNLLDKLSLLVHFPTKIKKLKEKISKNRAYKLSIKQNSRHTQEDAPNFPTSEHDR